MPFAHIAGIPVEETALSFGPVIAAAGGLAMLKLRSALRSFRCSLSAYSGDKEQRKPIREEAEGTDPGR